MQSNPGFFVGKRADFAQVSVVGKFIALKRRYQEEPSCWNQLIFCFNVFFILIKILNLLDLVWNGNAGADGVSLIKICCPVFLAPYDAFKAYWRTSLHLLPTKLTLARGGNFSEKIRIPDHATEALSPWGSFLC